MKLTPKRTHVPRSVTIDMYIPSKAGIFAAAGGSGQILTVQEPPHRRDLQDPSIDFNKVWPRNIHFLREAMILAATESGDRILMLRRFTILTYDRSSLP